MISVKTWLKWSLRDLRARWVQVAAIALVIAIGTGTYAGLSSTTRWRVAANEASFGMTNMHDLRVQLSKAAFVPRGSLIAALAEVVGAGTVLAAEERIIIQSQVSVETKDGQIIVPGRIIGVDLSAGGPYVDSLFVHKGRSLDAGDIAELVVVIEGNFAKFYDLEPEGALTLSGFWPMDYVGHALAPEYFLVMTEEGGLLAQENFAAVFTSLETAMALAAAVNSVNDMVVTLTDGVDAKPIAAALQEQVRDLGGTVLEKLDDPSYRLMTEDVEGDQLFYDILAAAIFVGAVFAAFNLIGRVVESQRHEIGVAMALGVPPRVIALRPILFGLQIALVGVVFGIGVGVGLGSLMGSVLEEFIPLPFWEAPFQFDLFVGVALLGLAVPLVAIAYPVWRAVRVAPVEAIRTGHLAARGGGLAKLFKGVPLPGSTLLQMPFRNLVRAPRRMVLTSLGIAAIISILVLILGMVDSFFNVLDQSEREVLGNSPNRVAVDLDTIYRLGGTTVEGVKQASALVDAEPALQLNGALINDDAEVDVFLTFTNFESTLWTPTIVEGAVDTQPPGVVIAKRAAEDLGVSVGDLVTLRHPVATDYGKFTMRDAQVPVMGIHANPYRFYAYMDVGQTRMTGMGPVANVVYGQSAPGVSEFDLKSQLMSVGGVGSVRSLAASTRALRDLMDQFISMLWIVEGAVLLLALLIAYNAASINMDERAREHATMMAFGIPVSKVLQNAAIESALLGVIATLLGLVGGYILLQWLVITVMTEVMPDLGMDIVVSPQTLITASVLGVLAVAITPLLSYRKLRRMDLPSTLRVME